ncbi:hypothetical protein BLJ79_21550 [Arthrobacter sp. UCD-GKA]|uniref:hypothetical protein n=1 Tax=Arthrobacter sp. UCD-GKA TaxID=1913576 RepID=UPI0008DE3DDD|nr:hypothetical protein [Arthrobacter sp. UCD-GKA]OIH81946.1 hypothetical protein BLJ79_21550 [Arthrobacter sp. UCD-GKA]
MTIAQYAHRLTRAHLSFMPDGRAGEVPSLLDELREAVTGSGDLDRTSSSTGKPLPLNSTALELLDSIGRMAGEDHYRRYDERFFGTLEGLLQKIAEDDHPAEFAAWFERIFMEWCQEIDAMVRPAKVRRLDNVECPSCGQKVYGDQRETCVAVDCYKPGGGRELRPIGSWTASCRGCGAEWGADKMEWLVASLAA